MSVKRMSLLFWYHKMVANFKEQWWGFPRQNIMNSHKHYMLSGTFCRFMCAAFGRGIKIPYAKNGGLDIVSLLITV